MRKYLAVLKSAIVGYFGERDSPNLAVESMMFRSTKVKADVQQGDEVQSRFFDQSERPRKIRRGDFRKT